MPSYLDLIADDIVEPLCEVLRPRIEDSFNAVAATGAIETNTGTLPGTDGEHQVYRGKAPEMNPKDARVMLPLITFDVAQESNGAFSTFDGDLPDVTVLIDCAALDATSAGELRASVQARIKSQAAYNVPGFTAQDIDISSAPRVETRDGWPDIFHQDMIVSITFA